MLLSSVDTGLFDPRGLLGRETSSYLKGTDDAMMASAEYQLLIRLLLELNVRWDPAALTIFMLNRRRI